MRSSFKSYINPHFHQLDLLYHYCRVIESKHVSGKSKYRHSINGQLKLLLRHPEPTCLTSPSETASSMIPSFASHVVVALLCFTFIHMTHSYATAGRTREPSLNNSLHGHWREDNA